MMARTKKHASLTILDRLADKFTIGDDCWEWTAA